MNVIHPFAAHMYRAKTIDLLLCVNKYFYETKNSYTINSVILIRDIRSYHRSEIIACQLPWNSL